MLTVSGLVCLFDIGVMILTLRFPLLGSVMSPLKLIIGDLKIHCQYILSWSIIRKTKLALLKCLSAELGIHIKFCVYYVSLTMYYFSVLHG